MEELVEEAGEHGLAVPRADSDGGLEEESPSCARLEHGVGDPAGGRVGEPPHGGGRRDVAEVDPRFNAGGHHAGDLVRRNLRLLDEANGVRGEGVVRDDESLPAFGYRLAPEVLRHQSVTRSVQFDPALDAVAVVPAANVARVGLRGAGEEVLHLRVLDKAPQVRAVLLQTVRARRKSKELEQARKVALRGQQRRPLGAHDRV